MKTLFRLFVISLGLITFAASSAWAGDVTGLVTFIKETKAQAGQVNANFTAVKTAVDGNAADITANTGNITTNAAALPMIWASTDDTPGGITAPSGSGPIETNNLSINVPLDGFLVISGGAYILNLGASPQTFAVKPFVDGNHASGSSAVAAYLDAAAFASTPDAEGVSYTITVPVTAGAHTVTQEVGPYSGTGDFFYNAYNLTVIFIPGSQGTHTPLSSCAIEALPGEITESETGE